MAWPQWHACWCHAAADSQLNATGYVFLVAAPSKLPLKAPHHTWLERTPAFFATWLPEKLCIKHNTASGIKRQRSPGVCAAGPAPTIEQDPPGGGASRTPWASP